MTGILSDSLGRTIVNLRISVTDRCNFRCRYCMPAGGMTWFERAEILRYEEIERLTRIFVSLGISRVRLTGGEPLMRRDLPSLVARLRGIAGLGEIALTTNGYFLGGQAAGLAAAGLDRLNVSLDSLDRERFDAMTRRDHLDRVLKALPEAAKAGLGPIKLNVVLIRGVNDGEIPAFARLARSGPYIVRFIEFMPIGLDDGWSSDRVMTTAEVLSTIEAQGHTLHPVAGNGAGPASRYRFAGGEGEIGFISSVSDPFCDRCDRIRLTSDGRLRTCLFSLTETDLKTPMRSGANDAELAGLIRSAVAAKEPGHLINREGFVRPDRSMSSIGG